MHKAINLLVQEALEIKIINHTIMELHIENDVISFMQMNEFFP